MIYFTNTRKFILKDHYGRNRDHLFMPFEGVFISDGVTIDYILSWVGNPDYPFYTTPQENSADPDGFERISEKRAKFMLKLLA